MALPIGAAIRSASRFAMRNPFAVARLAKHAAGMRIAVPLDALRWFVAQSPPGRKTPTDVTISAQPPGIAAGANVELMGTKLRASAVVAVQEMRVDDLEFRVSLRLSHVDMQVLGKSDSPIVGLLKSGALDLSKPGNLANFMPNKPPALVSARDDELVVDLLKIPRLAANLKFRKFLRTLTPIVNVSSIFTEDDMLIIALRATPLGFPRALQAARG